MTLKLSNGYQFKMSCFSKLANFKMNTAQNVFSQASKVLG